jgi:hypothetical protein
MGLLQIQEAPDSAASTEDTRTKATADYRKWFRIWKQYKRYKKHVIIYILLYGEASSF